MTTDLEFLYHNDCLTYFNNKLYDGIFTPEMIKSSKKVITVGTSNNKEKFYGFYLEKGRENYFVFDEDMNKFPFKCLESSEIDYKGEVFKVITHAETVKIPAEQRLTFKELVDKTAVFNHTNPLDWLLYKIVAYALYVDRGNARISTSAGFGKDSMVNIIGSLVDSMANMYGATFAKLEYLLMNKMIILNELGNLKKEDMINMQEFLLATGAYFNTYVKRSRKTATTKEQYDISNLSLLIFYNYPEYYRNKGQDYFDQIFTKAVINRFIPFAFEGQLTTKFDTMLDVKQIVAENDGLLKDVIATILYYKNNRLSNIRYTVDRKVINFPEHLMRYDRTFNTILKYVSEYARSQEEFNKLSIELFKRYKDYEKLIVSEKAQTQIK